MRQIKVRRYITWEGGSTDTAISIEEYISMMKEYGASKAKSVRTSRRYLRSLGMEIDRRGRVIVEKTQQ